MRIGIDIDGVLTNVEEFELDYGSKYFYEKGNLSSIKSKLDFKGSDYLEKEDSDDFWSKGIYEYVKIKPRVFACEVIDKLKSEGNRIYIIKIE